MWLSKAFQAFANLYALVFKGLCCPSATISQLLALLCINFIQLPWVTHWCCCLSYHDPISALCMCTLHCALCICSVHVIPSAHRPIVRHHSLSPAEILLPPFSWVRLILVSYIEHQGNVAKKEKARSNRSIVKLRTVSSITRTRRVLVLWQEQVVLHTVILCYS